MPRSQTVFGSRSFSIAENARKENAGLENAAPKCRGGISRTGKCKKSRNMEHRKFLKVSHAHIHSSHEAQMALTTTRTVLDVMYVQIFGYYFISF